MKPSPNPDSAKLFEHGLLTTRRQFLGRSTLGLGAAALASLLRKDLVALPTPTTTPSGPPHFPSKAKRVIYLFQSGAPSQLDLFDYKPALRNWQATELPG